MLLMTTMRLYKLMSSFKKISDYFDQVSQHSSHCTSA